MYNFHFSNPGVAQEMAKYSGFKLNNYYQKAEKKVVDGKTFKSSEITFFKDGSYFEPEATFEAFRYSDGHVIIKATLSDQPDVYEKYLKMINYYINRESLEEEYSNLALKFFIISKSEVGILTDVTYIKKAEYLGRRAK